MRVKRHKNTIIMLSSISITYSYSEKKKKKKNKQRLCVMRLFKFQIWILLFKHQNT